MCDPKNSGALRAVIGDISEGSAHEELSWVFRSRGDGVVHLVLYSVDPSGYDVVGVDQTGLNMKFDDGTLGSLCRCFTRPALLVTRYSHLRWRVAHRSQVGFLRLHLTLEAEHAWQLSRSFGAVRVMVLAGERVGLRSGLISAGSNVTAMVRPQPSYDLKPVPLEDETQ